MVTPLYKKLCAEGLGTFCLVFAGTGAIVINDLGGEAVSHVGIALTFGLMVLAMVYTIGDISGAHINPAVTVAFTVARRFPISQAGPYVLSQLLGASLASFVVFALFPGHETLGATNPAGSEHQTFVLEVVLSFMLMFVILSVSTGAKEKGVTAGIAIGAVVGLEALFAGPISGASMNPARSFGPALMAFDFSNLWIYLSAPVIGALIAIPACCCIRESACCTGSGDCEGL